MRHSMTRPASRYSSLCSATDDNTLRLSRRSWVLSDSDQPGPAPSPSCLLSVRCSQTSKIVERSYRCLFLDRTRERTAAANRVETPGTVHGFPPAYRAWPPQLHDPES